MKERTELQRRAADILAKEPTSRVAVESALVREGAVKEELGALLDGVDWDEQAVRAAQYESTRHGTTPAVIEIILRGKGFTSEQRQRAMASLDLEEVIDGILRELALNNMAGEAYTRAILENDGFSRDQMDAAIARLEIDWERIAVQAARKLLEGGRSRRGLYLSMEELGYTRPEIRAALRTLHVDWFQEALKAAQFIAGVSPEAAVVLNALKNQGFTSPEIEYAMGTLDPREAFDPFFALDTYLEGEGISEENMLHSLQVFGAAGSEMEAVLKEMRSRNIDWLEASVKPIQRRLESSPTASEVEMTQNLLSEGYSREQIRHAFEILEPKWPERALEAVMREEAAPAVAPSRLVQEIEKRGVPREEAQKIVAERCDGRTEEESALRHGRLLGRYNLSAEETGRTLMKGGYSQTIVDAVLPELYFDWEEQAAGEAARILSQDTSADVSPGELRLLLNLRGFSERDAEAAVRTVEADWDRQAENKLRNMIQAGWAEKALKEQLKLFDFSEETIQRALKELAVDEIDWERQAQKIYDEMMQKEAPDAGSEDVRKQMEVLGYPPEQIEHAEKKHAQQSSNA